MDLKVDAAAFCRDLEGEFKKLMTKADIAADKYVDEILAESYEQVPKNTGALSNSQYREKVSSGDVVAREFGYGGSNVQINPESLELTSAYALEVHEDLNAFHPNGGKAKFLEDPANKFAEDIESRLRADLE